MSELIGPVANTGFTRLYQPVGEPTLDIIFVHGLQGHPQTTWTTQQREKRGVGSAFGRLFPKAAGPDSTSRDDVPSRNGVFWPRDLLPEDCPTCRVLTWGYDSHVTRFFSGPANQNSFFNHAKNLLYALDRDRATCQGRGLIFVAHSLGGIIVKEVLRLARSDDQLSLLDIHVSTRAVLFLGTPHRGSELAPLGNTIRRIVGAPGFDTNDRNISALRFDSVESELSREEFMKTWRAGSFDIRTFQESRGLKGLKGFNGKVVPDFSSSFDDARERAQHIDANHMDMCRFHNRHDTGYEQVVGEIKAIVGKYKASDRSAPIQKVLDYSDNVESNLRNEILRSLAFPEMDSRQASIEAPSHHTCGWLKSLSSYQNWFHQGPGFLWLKGKVGAGKSTLMKHALEETRSVHHGSKTVVAGYFHNSRGAVLEQSPLGLFRSIIYQIFFQDRTRLSLYAIAYRKTQEGQNSGVKRKLGIKDDWTLKELQDMCLSAVISGPPSPMFIFIDALDEGETSYIRKLLGFWEQTVHSVSLHGINLRICLASRHYPNVSLRDCPEIWMEDHNMVDISTHVQRTLGSSSTDQEAAVLISIVLAKASGIFLWVVLVVEILLKAEDDGETFGQKCKRLQGLPSKLEELFEMILKGISTDQRHDTFQILKWVTFAKRRLSPVELYFATALETSNSPFSLATWIESEEHIKTLSQMSKWVRSQSKGLVELKRRAPEVLDDLQMPTLSPLSEHYSKQTAFWDLGDTTEDSISVNKSFNIQFIHDSLEDFLLSKGLRLLNNTLGDNVIGQCHNDLAKICLKYLSNPALCIQSFNSTYNPSMGVQPARDDTSHRTTSQDQTAMETLRVTPIAPAMLNVALSRKSSLESQLKADFGEHDPRITLPFLDYAVAALFHHAEQAEKRNVAQTQLISGLSGPSAWTFQCWLSFAKIFQNPRLDFENGHTTMLKVVAVRNMLSAVNYILENTTYERQYSNLDLALRAVARVGHLEVAQRLLKAEASPRGSNGLGKNALHVGCEYGHVSVVQEFLASDADVDSSTIFGWRALHWANEKGHLDVLQLLLNTHADVEATNQDGETPLIIAARTGNTAIFSILLSVKSMIGIGDHFGRTPLHQAVRFHHNAIVRILLDQNVNVNARTTDGLTVLDVALVFLNQEAEHMLLAKGAKVSKASRILDDIFTLWNPNPIAGFPDRSMTASLNPYQMQGALFESPRTSDHHGFAVEDESCVSHGSHLPVSTDISTTGTSE